MKVTLNDVGSLIDATTAQTTINNNSAVIETAFDNTLSLDGTAPNQMQTPLDMNSKQIVNLPNPATNTSPLRLQDLVSFVGGGTVTNIPAGGTTGQVLKKNSNTNYDVGFTNSVTSVGLALPADLTVTNSPVTTTGTLTGVWATTPTGTGAMVRATSPVLVSPTLGTPVSGTLTNTTGLPITTGVSGMASGVSTFLATPTSANLLAAMTDETGTGVNVFGTSPTITTPNIVGTATNNNAAAGSVGEYVQGDRVSGSALALTTSTFASLTSISLTAGDWDVTGFINFTPAATTNVTVSFGCTSLANNTIDTTPFGFVQQVSPTTAGTVYNNSYVISLPTRRLSLSATTTVYLVAESNFTVSTLTSYGSIRARRIR